VVKSAAKEALECATLAAEPKKTAKLSGEKLLEHRLKQAAGINLLDDEFRPNCLSGGDLGDILEQRLKRLPFVSYRKRAIHVGIPADFTLIRTALAAAPQRTVLRLAEIVSASQAKMR